MSGFLFGGSKYAEKSSLENYATKVDLDGYALKLHKAYHENNGLDEINVAGLDGLLNNNQNPVAHYLGGISHSADTLDNLNSKISDAYLGTPINICSSGTINLNNYDSGNVYTNEGATSEVVFSLPVAEKDVNFTFIVKSAVSLKIVANTNNTIRVKNFITSVAGNISSSLVGNYIKLIALNSSEYVAIYSIGTWLTDVIRIYADSSLGDDLNSGLDASLPKKTVAAVLDLIPDVIEQQIVIQLLGTHNIPSDITKQWSVRETGKILITGDPVNRTVVNNNGGLNWTATGSTVNSITVTGAGWTIDAFKGYMIEVLTGDATGETRTIQKNTATVITPTVPWDYDPGVGATFRISKPSTRLESGTGGYCFLTFFINSENTALYNEALLVQDISLYDVTLYFIGAGNVCLTHIFSEGNNGYIYFEGKSFNITQYRIDINTLDYDYISYCALGYVVTSNLEIAAPYAGSINISSSVFNYDIVFYYSNVLSFILEGGLIARKLIFQNCITQFFNIYAYDISFVFKNGIILKNSSIPSFYVQYAREFNISNVTGSAIELDNTLFVTTSVISGTGNSKAGVYAHDGAKMQFKSTAVPTITGTIGDLTLDNSTLKSAWSAITTLADLNTMTLIRKV